jgi:hypothetical protein
VQQQQRLAAPDRGEMDARAPSLYETAFNAWLCIRHGSAGLKITNESYQPVCVRASAMNKAGGCDG